MIANWFARVSNGSASSLWLVFLRCSVGTLTLLNYLSLQSDFDNIFSATAFIPPDISNVIKNPLLPSVYGVHQLLGVGYPGVLLTIRILYPLVLLMMALGLFTRVSAFLSLVLQLTLLNSMEFYTYGLDEFTTIALFYCFIFPLGHSYSLDKYLFKSPADTSNYFKYLLLFRVHICIAYFFSGFEKLLGYNWRNGESIWRMIHGYNMLSFVNLDFLYKTPIFHIAGWLTICLEMFYPIFINVPKTRKYWLAGVISFHVLIAFFMGLYFFSAMMIILNLTAYYVPFTPMEKVKLVG